jgi:hypothetical protein
MESGVVTLRVFGPDQFTFGPEQLITSAGITDDDGHFSTLVPITAPGEYQASLSDKKGYIGEYTFQVTGSEGSATIPVVITPLPQITPPAPEQTTSEPTSIPPTTPTRAQSPLQTEIVISGILAGYLFLVIRR